MPTVPPNWQRGHDELGAACFTSAIFSVAMLPKMTPLEVAAREFLLVVKAHLSCYCFVSQPVLRIRARRLALPDLANYRDGLFEWLVSPTVETLRVRDITYTGSVGSMAFRRSYKADLE